MARPTGPAGGRVAAAQEDTSVESCESLRGIRDIPVEISQVVPSTGNECAFPRAGVAA